MSRASVSSTIPPASPYPSVESQAWFIPFDILLLIPLICTVLLSIIFLFLVIVDPTCHTVSMMLVANSAFSGLVFTITLLWSLIITLHNDVKRILWDGSMCVFRSYLCYVTGAGLFYSYFLQAIYRYLTVLYPTRLFWQSLRVQICLIVLSWILAFIYALPHVFTGAMQYLADDQICQMPLHLSVLSVYNVFYVYVIPMSGIVLVYIRLIRHVKQMNRHITPANTFIRVQRELRMVHRVVILISILLILGIPYALFIFMGFFTHPPKYHFRIAFIFVNGAQVFVIIALFCFTDSVRTSLAKRIFPRRNVVAAVIP